MKISLEDLKRVLLESIQRKGARDVALLAASTALSQGILVLIAPLLTRLYTPQEFGVFSKYMALVGVVAVGASGRYEMAIVLPKEDLEGDGLLYLSLLLVICSVVLLYISMFVVEMFDGGHLVLNRTSYLFLVPLGVLLMGSYNALSYWHNRYADYKTMGKSRVVRRGARGALQILINGIGASGLILGSLFGDTAGVFVLAKKLIENFNAKVLCHYDKEILYALAKKYKAFPLQILPAQWIGVAATRFPVLIFASFGNDVVGYYGLVTQVVAMPISVVANAVGDVYRQKAAVAFQEKGRFDHLFLSTLKWCLLVSLPIFGFMVFILPLFVGKIFGERWGEAALFVRWLAVLGFFEFVFTPVDKGAVIVQATKYILGWHIVRIGGYALVFVAVCQLKISVQSTLLGILAINILLHVTDGIVGYHFSLGHGDA